MPQLVQVSTATPEFTSGPITDDEGAAMFRAAVNLFRYWQITDTDAALLLDLPPRSFARWKAGAIGRIGRDQKGRLSNLVGIHKALRLIFREPEQYYGWIKLPNQVFGGRSALDIM